MARMLRTSGKFFEVTLTGDSAPTAVERDTISGSIRMHRPTGHPVMVIGWRQEPKFRTGAGAIVVKFLTRPAPILRVHYHNLGRWTMQVANKYDGRG
jgi:hypothetical protein